MSLKLVSVSELQPSERLLVDRRRREESQVEAAARLGVSLYQYRAWEDGVTEVGLIAPALEPRALSDEEQCIVARVRRGVGVVALAKLLDVSRYWLSRMERGTAPSKRLADYWVRRIADERKKKGKK